MSTHILVNDTARDTDAATVSELVHEVLGHVPEHLVHELADRRRIGVPRGVVDQNVCAHCVLLWRIGSHALKSRQGFCFSTSSAAHRAASAASKIPWRKYPVLTTTRSLTRPR